MVVLAQFAVFAVDVTVAGDLSPQCQEEDNQTHQTEDYRSTSEIENNLYPMKCLLKWDRSALCTCSLIIFLRDRYQPSSSANLKSANMMVVLGE